MTEAWVFLVQNWHIMLGSLIFQLSLQVATGWTWRLTNWRWWCVTLGSIVYGALAWGPQ